ncbi:MAG: ABC-F family ATP-binding cassette domain-containing protein [Ruminococcaceae bacterium]|nr:ABC-F family ATP-binding cassette domain-containing protein [Oscillospiraceae bacterium]
MLITIDNLSKSFGQEEILKNVKLTVNEKCRYGLIGVNGAGKSTLLKIIMGTLSFEEGEVIKKPGLKIGYLEQNNGLERDSSIIIEMRKVFEDVYESEQKMRALELEMAEISDQDSDEYRRIASEYTRAQNFFDSRDGYNIDVKIKTILNGMGFGDRDMDTVISTLSGGEKTRLAIARLLLEEPELLILDEPTNHLDFKTLKWLEEYLVSYNGAILTVSHDRYFLDKIVTHIYEVERGRVYSYAGNYSKYLPQKAERRARQEKEYEMQQMQIAQLQTYVDKNIARASTSNSAKSRLKTLENMEIIERPDGDLKSMRLRFEHTKDPYKDVLTVTDLDIAVGEEQKVLCRNINLAVKKKEKIAIIGSNGIGKSSFLKIIQGIIPHYKGNVEWGNNVSISYYEQEILNLNQDKIALDELWDRFPDVPEAEIRRVLGNVLLTKDDVFKPVKIISGGERAKLAFCIIMLEKANVIILDEPTNHLDLASKEVLEEALSGYEGTLIFVSHDRYLLNKVPDKIVEINRNGLRVFQGNYDYYCEVLEREALSDAEAAAAHAAAKAAEAVKNQAATSYRSKEQRRLEAQRKNRIRELEELIEETETKLSLLEEEMTTEAVFSDYKLMTEKCSEADALRQNLEKYYDEWGELE